MVKLLDCTLRDGGFGLEDMENYRSNSKFSKSQIKAIEKSLSDSKIDFVEVGAVQITEKDRTGFAIYQNIENASSCLTNQSERYAIFYRGPDTPISAIPDWNEKIIRKIRLCLRYSELKKSIDYCYELSKKGYEIFIQPMVTLRYTADELDYVIRSANDMHAFALYFVDSYGCMDYTDVEKVFNIYNKGLDSTINIGFHAHNNKNMAFANVRQFIELATTANRNVIIDSTCIGMGQGAGNLQTELIVPYMNDKLKKNYNFNSVLEACDVIDGFNPENLWGYSVYRFLPTLYNTAYKYAVAMRLKYKMSFIEINRALKEMPDNLRQRYTPTNLKEYLEGIK